MVILDTRERIVRAIKIDALREELETRFAAQRSDCAMDPQGANPGPAITLFSGQR